MSFGFGVLKKHYELTPLFSLIGGVCVMAGSYIGYALITKSDVVVNRSANPFPWDKVDPSKPQKLFTVSQKWTAIPELEQLRREIGSPASPNS
ncbi:normal mucosa of esophagus-specific gene 1 protein-like [Ptychodera flava]|uniref:normal mucosa of esophagus-specific gene 1 protein-like n=1 Tax=Ptychodera flava TaxID=63121 RepID=UPI003969CB98